MTFKLRHGASMADTDYGVVLLDEDSGQYWNLNPTGVLILRTLLDGGSLTEAARQLTGEYEVAIETAHRDVEDLVGEFRSAGLVES